MAGVDAAILQTLGIHAGRERKNARVLRAGFEHSGVSQGNRLLEFFLLADFPSAPGSPPPAATLSHDFALKDKDQPGGDPMSLN